MRFEDLDHASLAGATVFLDVDGTLVADKGETLAPPAIAAVTRLADVTDLYLCSNGNGARTKRLAEELGVAALPKLRKPLPHAAVRSITRRERTIVIGDKFLTDGLFALMLGAEFIMVESLREAGDSISAQLTYAVDGIAWRLAGYLALMRPHQWIKNGLVFAPLFFAGALFMPGALMACIYAFIAFSLAASMVYTLNDVFDRTQDRLHPKKRNRPLASGRVSVPGAFGLIAVLAALLALALFTIPAIAPLVILYIALNGAYTAWFKHIAVIDILCVASFYIMRIMAGGSATGIPLSPWIFLCVFFAALFIILGKRRAEFRHESRRKVLEQYSREALDVMLAGAAVLAIISYGLYTVLGHDLPLLIYSTIFVVLAFFRTLNRLYTHPEHAEAPERILFTDPWVFASFVLWGGYVFMVFYLAA